MVKVHHQRYDRGSELARLLAICLVFLLVMFGASYPVLFCLDYLLHDDSARYALAIRDKVPFNLAGVYPLLPFFEWPIYKLMAGTSATVARATQWIAYAVPAAILLYLFYRKHLHFPAQGALFAAILPMCYPNQHMIPAGINISYPLPTMFGIAALLFVGANILSSDNFSKAKFAVYILVLLFVGYYSPNAPFVLSAISFFLVCLLIVRRKRSLQLLVPTLVVAVERTISALGQQRKATSGFDLNESLSRVLEYLSSYALPLSDEMAGVTLMGLKLAPLLILAMLLVILSQIARWPKLPSRRPWPFAAYNRSGLWLLVVCCAVWVVATIAPYVTILDGVWQQPRYFWISGFGIAPLIALAVFMLCAYFPEKYAKSLSAVILLSILLLVSFERVTGLQSFVTALNSRTEHMRAALLTRVLPKRSQLVLITDSYPPHPGVPKANIGFVWYLHPQLESVSYALIFPPSDERTWYNPHKKGAGSWRKPSLTGISERKPLFIFRQEDDGVRQINRYLQVIPADNGEDLWNVYQLNPATGRSVLSVQGIGVEEYRQFYMNLSGSNPGVDTDIAFGNIP